MLLTSLYCLQTLEETKKRHEKDDRPGNVLQKSEHERDDHARTHLPRFFVRTTENQTTAFDQHRARVQKLDPTSAQNPHPDHSDDERRARIESQTSDCY